MPASSAAIRAGRAFVEVFADDSKAQRVLKGFERRMRNFGQMANRIGGGFLKFGGIGTAVLIGLGAAALRSAGQFEQLETSFTVLLGSAEAAKKLLKELSTFAVETPFESGELGDAAKQLLAFGTAADDIVPTLRQLGDIAAGLNIPLADMAYLFGTTKVQGRLFAQDLNQFVSRGIPLIEELAKQFGVAQSEVRKLVEDGRVGFPQVQQAIISLTSAGGRFAGLMEKQSQTQFGQLSTLRDGLAVVSRIFGGTLLPFVKTGVGYVLKFTDALAKWAEENQEIVKTIALITVGATAAFAVIGAAGVALLGLSFAVNTFAATAGLLAKGLGVIHFTLKALPAVLAAITSPLGLTVAAVAGLGVGLLYLSGIWETSLERGRQLFHALGVTAVAAWRGIVDAVGSGDLGLAFEIVMASFNVSWAQAMAAIQQTWSETGAFLVNTWDIFSTEFVLIVTDAFSDIESAWVSLTYSMKTMWSQVFRSMVSEVASLFKSVAGALDERFQLPAFKTALRELSRFGRGAEIVAGAAGRGVDKSAASDLAELGAIEGRREETKGQVKADRDARVAGRTDVSQDPAVKAAQEALAAAQAELGRLTGKAAELAAKGKEAGSPASSRLPPIPSLASLSGAGASVVGTFSAAAARGFGTGNDGWKAVASKQDVTNKHLEKIAGKKAAFK